jgi:hypothetical protein
MERTPFIGAINAVVSHSLACVSLTVILMMIIFTIISIIGLLPSPQCLVPYKEIPASAQKSGCRGPNHPAVTHGTQTQADTGGSRVRNFQWVFRFSPAAGVFARTSISSVSMGHLSMVSDTLEPFHLAGQSAAVRLTVRPEAGPTGRFFHLNDSKENTLDRYCG